MLETPPRRSRATEAPAAAGGEAPAAADTAAEAEAARSTAPRPAPEPAAQKAPKKGRLRRWLRRAFILVVVAGLAVGAYLVWPDVYERYIAPIDTNTAGLGELEAQLATTEAALTEAQQTIDALDAQVASLVEAGAVVGDLQVDVAALIDGLAEQVAAAEVATQRLDAAERTLDRTGAQTDDLADAVDALSDDVATAQARFEDRTAFLTAVQLLSRGRLFLYQANYGLAEADIQVARDLLADRTGTAPAENLVAAIERLDLVLEALPATPVLASDDLDIAWQLLLDPAVP